MAAILQFVNDVDLERASASNSVAEHSLSVLIADDHPIVREGTMALLSRQPNMRIAAVAANGREAVELFIEHSPDVSLIDLRMPVMDGLEAVAAIRQRSPDARLIIFSSWDREEDIYRAMRAGVQGYVVKGCPIMELLECIAAVGNGGVWVPQAVGAQLVRHLKDSHVTAREQDVLSELAIGRCNKEIAARLSISEATVKVHVTHLLEKLKVTSRTEAISAAIRRGLVHVEGAYGK